MLYTLQTGKTIWANKGIIGLSPELDLYDGYDCLLWEPDNNPHELTSDELAEIADLMIERWIEFKKIRRV
jgi:hypothetical protein